MTNTSFQKKKDLIQITNDYTGAYTPVDKNAFAEFIREKRREYNERNGDELTTRGLSSLVGIEYEMFRKILNQEKPTKKRDCIIAIGVALQLFSGEINEALGLYQYMPSLDKENPREEFIMKHINANPRISVQGLNNALIKFGFPGLDIQDKRKGKEKGNRRVLPELPYVRKETKTRTPLSIEYYYGDQYNSLCTRYDPDRYKSFGDMILEDKKNKQFIRLCADSDDEMSSQILQKEMINPTRYKSIEETGDFKDYFVELKSTIQIEKRRLLGILNDTKNYQKRTSARLIEDSICIFSEQYNYVIPELNEYYMVILSAKRYKLYVYSCSAFMSWYLSENEYKKNYGAGKPEPQESYDSMEQLDKLIEESNKHSEEYIRFRMRKNAFRQLMDEVDLLYQGLLNGEEFIQNLDYIYDIPYDALRHYGLEDDFECKYDEEYGEICGCIKSKEYTLDNGETVTITFNDVCEAFKFGFSDLKEMCRIKAKYGSIEAVMS